MNVNHQPSYGPLMDLWIKPINFFSSLGIIGVPFVLLYTVVSIILATAGIVALIWGGAVALMYVLFQNPAI